MTKAEPCVLIANRAEIACRVIKTCKRLGVRCVAVFTEADRGSTHTKLADEAFYLGEHASLYTSISDLLKAAEQTRATAIHPGYGFLSESPEMVDAAEGAGLVWLGPRAQTMRDFALKHVAKDAAVSAGVPVLGGSGVLSSADEAADVAEKVGYPVLLKAVGGGGGMGIHKCFSREQILSAYPIAVRQGEKSFGNPDVFVEKFVQAAKHIEVQVFGDGEGHVLALADRECSVQRRHQKVIEECPSPFVDAELRERLLRAATDLCSAARYRSAGTVEFLLDAQTREFYFLEINARLQVEHGITEMVTGSELVEMMLRLQIPIVAKGKVEGSTPAEYQETVRSMTFSITGHAIECRLCAEDPCNNLNPSSGPLGEVTWPEAVEGLRIDTFIHSGVLISPSFDSLLAKVMTHGGTREEALGRMRDALRGSRVKGVPNNMQLHQAVLDCDDFVAGTYTTSLLDTLKFEYSFVEVIDGGVMTTVQDHPGRVKLWHVGVPPSGPMDPAAFRYANALVGNADDAAGLEVTLRGPSLKFHRAATVAVCGASFQVSVDGEAAPMWKGFRVPAGATLDIGSSNEGSRCYVAVDGGFDAPKQLGSRATFPSGNLGGYQGRPLQTGDSCELGPARAESSPGVEVPSAWRPGYGEAMGDSGVSKWNVRMLPGPQADPDYFTEADIKTLFSEPYEVHYNSNRLGIRLTGPRPEFARPDGGDGGAHPSNVHDHVYALGTINFSGDMPIILTADGPSLGGFVCPATTIEADMGVWGQVRPGDQVHFVACTLEEALAERLAFDARESALCTAACGGDAVDGDKVDSSAPKSIGPAPPQTSAILRRTEDSVWRLAGDRYVFVEFGDMVLDFQLRAKVYELEVWLADNAPVGFLESSPGVRSALLEYDARVLPLVDLMKLLERAEAELPDVTNLKVPSRVLHLPMAFHERWTREAMEKYQQSVRPEAVYLPDNVPFVAENNALEGGVEELKSIMFEASYMVFGLGDVYLGAPCAVPVNPLHRLVVPKYNPARTFTWEGTVGLGGAYLCIYPMNSPGGYQLMGRTLPIWNMREQFGPNKPWMLNIFDQIRFYEVSETELEDARREFAAGMMELKISEDTFDFGAHAKFCAGIQEEVKALRAKQGAAAKELRERDAEILKRLEAAGYRAGAGAAGGADMGMGEDSEATAALEAAAAEPERFEIVRAPFAASVWEVSAEAGAQLAAGAAVCVLEAMKMETVVATAAAGAVVAMLSSKGSLVTKGQPLCVVEKA